MTTQAKLTTSVLMGIIFCILAGFFWGTTGVARALGPESASSLGVVGVRVSVAAVALLIMCLADGTFKSAGPVLRWPYLEMAISGFFLGLFTYVYLEAMKLAGVALGAAISCASIPVFSMIFETLVLRIRPTSWQFVGFMGCVVGGTMVSWYGSGGGGAETINPTVLKGCLLALLSGVIFSGYSLLIQRAVNKKGAPYNLAITGMFIVAAIIWLPYALLNQDMSWLGENKGILMGLYIGLFSAAAGYFCYVRGIAKVPVSIAVSLGLAEPLTGTLLGIFLLGEKINLPTALGMLILFVGIYVIGQATVSRTKKTGSTGLAPEGAPA